MRKLLNSTTDSLLGKARSAAAVVGAAQMMWWFAGSALAQPVTTNTPAHPDSAHPDSNGFEEVGHVLLSALGPMFENTPVFGWLSLLGAIFLGVLLGKVSAVTLRAISRRADDAGQPYRAAMLRAIASPLNLLLITMAISSSYLFIYIDPNIHGFLLGTTQMLLLVALSWFSFNLVELLEVALMRVASKTSTKLDNYLVPVIGRTLRIFIIIIFSLVIAQNVFELNVTGWLAGLGIAGLAVSLAAQDSIKNLFGSITVLFDKPFIVGERVRFMGTEGTVETIGFRATRIRTLEGHLVTMPNMKFIDNEVENVTARPFMRRICNVTITYDTPAEKIEQAVQILKDILHDATISAPFDMEKLPPRVAFDDFNADSLNIRVMYWYTLKKDERDFFTYLDHAQDVNLRIFRAYEQAGIDFAFPSQTLYLANDDKRQLAVRVLADQSDNGG